MFLLKFLSKMMQGKKDFLVEDNKKRALAEKTIA